MVKNISELNAKVEVHNEKRKLFQNRSKHERVFGMRSRNHGRRFDNGFTGHGFGGFRRNPLCRCKDGQESN